MTNDLQGRIKVKAVIRKWMTAIEEAEQWQDIPQTLQKTIRRGLIRSVWSAYKIGLFTITPPDEGNTIKKE